MSVLDDRVAWHQASVTQTLLVGGRREEEAQLSPSCPEGLGKEVPPPPPSQVQAWQKLFAWRRQRTLSWQARAQKVHWPQRATCSPSVRYVKGHRRRGAETRVPAPPFP